MLSQRFDQRKFKQIRTLHGELGIVSEASGSSKLSVGNTTAIARVYGPCQPKHSRLQNSNECTVEVEVSIADDILKSSAVNASSSIWKQKHHSQYLKSLLESTIPLNIFPRLFIYLQVTVIQDDGGALACAANAAILSLLDSGIPMKWTPCTISLGGISILGDGSPKPKIAFLIDPTKEEEEGDRSIPSQFVFSLVHSTENDAQIVASDCCGRFSEDSLFQAISHASETAGIVHSFFREIMHDKQS
jgi:ribonuclease PH